ncbi:MAG: SDR family NAD(P)-dependent oxidoreductase [Nanoarchaeota archaeon]|nr:SDR family NAD(P)-dependent oxidoreductase [Nanoarchaeota archaeon]
MKTALVTGGAGFIGSHLVEALAEKGYKIKVIDSLIKGKLSTIKYLADQGKLEFFEGDIRNRDSVDKAMKGVDYVFHTAGIHIEKSAESPEDCIEANVHGSYNVFKSALDHNVKRVIFSSSSSVYGNPKTLPMSEESEMNIVEPYGASKLMAEHLLKFLGTKGLRYNILRYFNVYGSRQAVHAYYTTVVIHFINRIMKGEAPIIDGKGDQSMDFTHVSDVVQGNILAAESAVEMETFNIGTGKSTSVAQLAEIIIKALGKDIKPQFREREVLVSRRQADISKAEKMLGYRCKVNVEDGMAKVAKEIAEHPELYRGR